MFHWLTWFGSAGGISIESLVASTVGMVILFSAGKLETRKPVAEPVKVTSLVLGWAILEGPHREVPYDPSRAEWGEITPEFVDGRLAWYEPGEPVLSIRSRSAFEADQQELLNKLRAVRKSQQEVVTLGIGGDIDKALADEGDRLFKKIDEINRSITSLFGVPATVVGKGEARLRNDYGCYCDLCHQTYQAHAWSKCGLVG